MAASQSSSPSSASSSPPRTKMNLRNKIRKDKKTAISWCKRHWSMGILMALLGFVMTKLIVEHAAQVQESFGSTSREAQQLFQSFSQQGQQPPPPHTQGQPPPQHLPSNKIVSQGQRAYATPLKRVDPPRQAQRQQQQNSRKGEPAHLAALRRQQVRGAGFKPAAGDRRSPDLVLPVNQRRWQPEQAQKNTAEEPKKKKKNKGPPPEWQRFVQGGHDNKPQAPQSSTARASDAHPVAGLSCRDHGGPYGSPEADQAVADMVYWRDIPTDAQWTSPHRSADTEEERFLTFEPDEGGFNNIRMAFETAVTLAVGTGRTLVLPPDMNFYLLTDPTQTLKRAFSFSDFYDLVAVAAEHTASLRIITFEEFLNQTALQGKLLDPQTGRPTFPPHNVTNWNNWAPNFLAYRTKEHQQGNSLWNWIRQVTTPLEWSFMDCVAAIPAQPGAQALQDLQATWDQVQREDEQRGQRLVQRDPTFLSQQKHGLIWRNRLHSHDDRPAAVNASAAARLSELLAQRSQLCVYDEALQQHAPVWHVKGEQSSGHRMLVHWYAFLFFQDWRTDVWMKRFVRDHLRYHDDIQCAAARLVHALRSKAQAQNHDNDATFHTMHIRRGDFQFKQVRHMTADEILANVQQWLPTTTANQTSTTRPVLYIATDEQDVSFFDVFRPHYTLYFLKDFEHLLQGVDAHYYGMVEQLVAAQGHSFTGVFFSTFSGYIHRLRGYLSQLRNDAGHELGQVRHSYYYAPNGMAEKRRALHHYQAVEPAFWNREFPVAWRDIDVGV